MFSGSEHFEAGKIPAYHEGMLLIKTKALPLMKNISVAAFNRILDESPGLTALHRLEAGGFLKKITPLDRKVEGAFAPMSGIEVLFGMNSSSDEKNLLSNISLVEIQRDSDIEFLQEELAKDPNVETVSRVPVRYLAVHGNATDLAVAAIAPPVSTLWNLNRIQWDQARSLSGFKDAHDIRVAVLDTGIDIGHPDLQGRIASYTFSHPDLIGVSSDKDIIGHGTHVAGTIAANINNNIGINGICDCQLHIWKIFDDRPDYSQWHDKYVYYVDTIMYHRALNDCLLTGVDVINLSIGGPSEPDFSEKALFKSLLERGVKIVAAMGNERQSGSPTSYPAAIPGVIAVGATSIDDKVANFSNAGNHITLSAPGVSIWSTLPTYSGQTRFINQGTRNAPVLGAPVARDTDYASWQGTSMAAPHVSAAVALLLANQGNMDSIAVRQRLMATADKTPNMISNAHDPDFGAGRLNLLRLLLS